MRAQSRAFTLVEVLVVLAIIGVLSGITFSIVASVKESARLSACASNLHQVAHALALYENDSDGKAPHDRIIDDDNHSDLDPTHRQAWDALAKYAASRQVFRCPSSHRGNQDLLGYGYQATSVSIQDGQDRHPLRFEPTSVVAFCWEHVQIHPDPSHPDMDEVPEDAEGHAIGRFNAVRADSSVFNIDAKQVDLCGYDPIGKQWVRLWNRPRNLNLYGMIQRFPGDPWPPELQP